jgi:membrane dipeptidase
LIALVQKIAATWPDKFAVATSTADVRTNFARGVMSLVLGLENGAPIAGDVKNLRRLHDRGIQYVTLCHGLDNHICDSSYDTTHTWNGLSPFGKTIIPEMNRIGMMIDVSHITDDACAQVLDLSTSPIIASHSSCRSFTPGFARNLPDELIRRIGANGGVVMVNFGSEFLTQTFQQWEAQRLGVIQQFMREHGVSRRDSSVRDFVREWRKEHPVPYASIGDLVDHIDRIVELAGIDHVGFGSDFEGLGDMLPAGLKDVSGYPNVVKELLRRGYSEKDVKKVCGENLMRVWEEVEAAAM